MAERMRVLIADDHDLVRDTIAAFLEREAGFEVSLARSFTDAAAVLERSGPFDLVLLDYAMPGMEGLGGLARAKALNGDAPVAIMSGHTGPNLAAEALAAGAAGFLPKTMAAKSLIHALNLILAGEQYLPASLMTRPPAGEPEPLAGRLSDRERQVLDGLCRGLSNKEIARELDLREVTIKLHVKTLCRKLEARNRTHAAMIAKKTGLF